MTVDVELAALRQMLRERHREEIGLIRELRAEVAARHQAHEPREGIDDPGPCSCGLSYSDECDGLKLLARVDAFLAKGS